MKPANKQTVSAPIRRIRFTQAAVVFIVWVLVIAARLVWLQVALHPKYMELAARQQQRTIDVAPRRGMLYDRNLRELAMTVQADSVYADPTEIADHAGMAQQLAAIVHTDPTDGFTSPEQIEARLDNSDHFAWIARRVDDQTSEQIHALNLKGIYFQKEFKRTYPNNEMAAQILGAVGTDDNGLLGMEHAFNTELHGTPGRRLAALDARRQVTGSEESDPLPGKNIVLTVDANIQYIAEHALDTAMQRTQAVRGTVVVQDPHTGQILALAVRPSFNPNDMLHADPATLRNSAVSDVYEPGSTFKLVTYSAALEEKQTSPDEIIDCQGGKINLYGRIIHDSHMGMGRVSVSQALWESSDVAAVKLALRLGNDKFYQYIKAFGFGDRTGIELPSETRGLLRPVKSNNPKVPGWSPTSIGSLAIGQEVGVTPVQLVSMVSSIGNGGVYLPPHIVLETTYAEKGDVRLQPVAFHPAMQLPTVLPEGAHRVISEMTSAEMRHMMEGIVLYGTGKEAQLNGYSAGGKTGTAQKIDVATRTYSKTNYVASFAGFAPVNNPAISVVVIMDSPKGNYYGQTVSAPVFRDVAQQVLEYLGVPHDQPVHTGVQVARAAAPEMDDAPQERSGDVQALYAEVNSLPEDDPLRNAASSDDVTQATVTPQTVPTPVKLLLPKETVAAWQSGALIAEENNTAPLPEVKVDPIVQVRSSTSVIVDAGTRVAVPSFLGETLREAVMQTNAAGLSLQAIGSGLAREQAPVAGTMAPLGTEVVVRFTR
jgi:cell division protein FtsI (penicillin-binding protein 3)